MNVGVSVDSGGGNAGRDESFFLLLLAFTPFLDVGSNFHTAVNHQGI